MSLLNPDTLRETFHDAQFHTEHRLIAWFPTGVLDDTRADRVVEFLENAEKFEGKPFDRFTDMTGYTRVQLGLDHIVRLARRRRRYTGPEVRSAFYAVRLLSLTIARMYEELMLGSKIQICTFADRTLAANWLGVPEAVLKPPREKRE